jgi:hypothetical protein
LYLKNSCGIYCFQDALERGKKDGRDCAAIADRYEYGLLLYQKKNEIGNLYEMFQKIKTNEMYKITSEKHVINGLSWLYLEVLLAYLLCEKVTMSSQCYEIIYASNDLRELFQIMQPEEYQKVNKCTIM